MQLLAQLCLRQQDAFNLMRLDRAFPHILSYAKPGIHAGDAVQHLPALEGAARGGPHGLPTSSCPLQVRHPGAQDSHHGGCRAAGQACHPDQEGMGDPGGGQGADVGDLDVEPVRAEGHPGSGHGPLPHSDAVKGLDGILNGLDGNILQRYHSTRPLSQQYAGEMVPFFMEISNRGETPRLVYQSLLSLSNSTVWFMVGARLKTETLKRSPWHSDCRSSSPASHLLSVTQPGQPMLSALLCSFLDLGHDALFPTAGMHVRRHRTTRQGSFCDHHIIGITTKQAVECFCMVQYHAAVVPSSDSA